MIDLDGISVTYPGGVQALKPTNLSFGSEITVLLGTSGAGKSTLLRSINQLVVPSSGTIRSASNGIVSGRDTLKRHRRDTAMVFQQHQLIGALTALKNVLTGRLAYHSTWRTLFSLSQEDRRIALAALERVSLLDFALRRTDSLSGGQQQRVGIARALAQQPAMVLADEPVASLDPATAANVLQLLSDICKSDGIGAIISLHQVQLAKRFADRIVGIVEGSIVFDGTPDELNDQVLARIYRQPVQDLAPEAELNGSASAELALSLAME